ncbi:MAG: hypothetical protein WBQ94_03485 [Terracidiphilus sp.]
MDGAPDQAQYVKMPDGSYGKFAANADDATIRAAIQKDFPDAFPAPKAPGVIDRMKSNWESNTTEQPNDSAFMRFGKTAARDLEDVATHPIDTVWNAYAHMGDALKNPIPSIVGAMNEPNAIPHALGHVASGALVGGILGAAGEGAGSAGSMIRNAAMDSPDVAALKGMGIGPKSDQAINTLNAVKGARPFLQGANSLEDLQSKVGAAKGEIWAPYEDAVSRIGDQQVYGPDGPTTVRALEQERQQLSALNRGIKSGNPADIQLATQKGMNQAQLLAREEAVKAALDPALESAGVKPLDIRKAFGQVAQVGGNIEGKSTLLDQKPMGFGRMARISPFHPFQSAENIASGIRDVAAGRPLWSGSPTDVGIREAFRVGGEKPNFFGNPTPMNAPLKLPANVPYNAPFEGDTGSPQQAPLRGREESIRPAPPVTYPRLTDEASRGIPQPMIGERVPSSPVMERAFARERPQPTQFLKPGAVPSTPGGFAVSPQGTATRIPKALLPGGFDTPEVPPEDNVHIYPPASVFRNVQETPIYPAGSKFRKMLDKPFQESEFRK